MKQHFKILAMLLFVCSTGFSQVKSGRKMPVDKETNLITYTKVTDMPDVSKTELYSRALTWANNFYKNPTDAIREKDTASATIICKHRFKIFNPVDKKSGVATDAGLVQYTLKLEFKENKYRYTFSDFNWRANSYYALERWMDTASQSYKPEYDYYLEQTDDKVKEIIKDLDKKIKGGAVNEKKDDW